MRNHPGERCQWQSCEVSSPGCTAERSGVSDCISTIIVQENGGQAHGREGGRLSVNNQWEDRQQCGATCAIENLDVDEGLRAVRKGSSVQCSECTRVASRGRIAIHSKGELVCLAEVSRRQQPAKCSCHVLLGQWRGVHADFVGGNAAHFVCGGAGRHNDRCRIQANEQRRGRPVGDMLSVDHSGSRHVLLPYANRQGVHAGLRRLAIVLGELLDKRGHIRVPLSCQVMQTCSGQLGS